MQGSKLRPSGATAGREIATNTVAFATYIVFFFFGN